MTEPITAGDRAATPWSAPLPPDVVRALSQVHPWRALGQVAFDWGVLAALLVGWSTLWHHHAVAALVVWPLAAVLVATRQHALGVLMHEGSHFRLARNRTANDVLGELFVGWPLLLSMRSYRRVHFAHHRYTNTDDDPDWVLKKNDDWVFPKRAGGLAALFVQDLLGLRTVELVKNVGRYRSQPRPEERWWNRARAAYYAVVLVAVTVAGVWPEFLLLWVVPIFTSLKAILRLRSIAEHFGLSYDHVLRKTRTTRTSLWERCLIAPHDVGYHLEHHLFPSVPGYNLPALHALLLQVPEFAAEAHVTDGYLGVLRECMGTADGGPR